MFLDSSATLAHSAHARAWLAHGTGKFYRCERLYSISLRQLPPRPVRVLLVSENLYFLLRYCTRIAQVPRKIGRCFQRCILISKENGNVTECHSLLNEYSRRFSCAHTQDVRNILCLIVTQGLHRRLLSSSGLVFWVGVSV